MMIKQILTTATEYTDKYNGDYFNCYQIHIFSFNQIFSTYYNRENISIDQVRLEAENLVSAIQKNSDRKNQGFLFASNGKILISESCDLCGDVELFVYQPQYVRYEPFYDYEDFFEFIGDSPADIYLKNALITIGAEELSKTIAPQIERFKERQESYNNQYNESRTLDKTDPKYVIEIYKIEKNYIPVKVQEIKSNQFETTMYLPEYRKIKPENRMGYIVTDIVTNKIVENGVKHAIEQIKCMKHLRANPTIMDLGDLQRMELDNEDPNFLSYGEFKKNDEDQYEEGDDEYIP